MTPQLFALLLACVIAMSSIALWKVTRWHRCKQCGDLFDMMGHKHRPLFRRNIHQQLPVGTCADCKSK